MDQAYISYINNVSNQLSIYFSGILFPLGIVFNVISAAVFFSSKNLNKTRMGHLYGLLCVVDTFSLLSNVLLIQFLPYLDPKLSFKLISDLTCRLSLFFNRAIVFTSSWLQMYISLDRWINIRYPKRFKALSSTRTINLVFVGIVIAMLVIAAENLLYTLIPSTKTSTSSFFNQSANVSVTVTTSTTTYTCTSSSGILFGAQIVSASMRTWIPLVFLMVINLFTIRILLRSRRRVSAIRDKSHAGKERQFTTTVLALNGIFFFMNFPLSVYWILNSIFNFFPSSVSAVFLANLNLYYIISLSMAYFYHALTFFINLAFNSLFRREIRCLFYRIARLPMPDSSTGHVEATTSFKTQKSSNVTSKPSRPQI